MTNARFIEILRAYRHTTGLSVPRLAKLVGMRTQRIHNLENQRAKPSLADISALGPHVPELIEELASEITAVCLLGSDGNRLCKRTKSAAVTTHPDAATCKACLSTFPGKDGEQ